MSPGKVPEPAEFGQVDSLDHFCMLLSQQEDLEVTFTPSATVGQACRAALGLQGAGFPVTWRSQPCFTDGITEAREGVESFSQGQLPNNWRARIHIPTDLPGILSPRRALCHGLNSKISSLELGDSHA